MANSPFGIHFKAAKGLFFDSTKVIKAVDRATRRVLSRFGAFVRSTARQSIRKRKKPSPPGSPPSSHSGLLKKFIFFSFDPNRNSVVIGPVRLSGRKGDAPQLLEHGGTARRNRRRRKNGRRRRKKRTLKYRPRPFMGPALEREQPKLPEMWRDAVKP